MFPGGQVKTCSAVSAAATALLDVNLRDPWWQAERVLALTGDNLWAAIDLNELPSPVERAFKALVSELPLPAIADADGYNPQTIVSSEDPIMSPAWSPDGRKLAYVLF